MDTGGLEAREFLIFKAQTDLLGINKTCSKWHHIALDQTVFVRHSNTAFITAKLTFHTSLSSLHKATEGFRRYQKAVHGWHGCIQGHILSATERPSITWYGSGALNTKQQFDEWPSQQEIDHSVKVSEALG
jgi:hypothetical protein